MSSADDSRIDGGDGGDNGGDGRGGTAAGGGGDDSQYSDNEQSIISSNNNNNNHNNNSNNNNEGTTDTDPIDDIKKRIIVRNLPKLYGWQDLKDIFRNIVGFVEFVELFKEDGDCCAVVEFRDAAFVPKAIKEMCGFKILNNIITVEEDDGTSKYDIKKPPPGTKSRRRRHEDRGSDRDEKFLKSRRSGFSGGGGGGGDGSIGGGIRGGSISSVGNDGPYNTYGLSISFLDSLGITGPLYPKVFVSNLDYHVDERKVKQIFKLAGKIINLDWSIDKEGNSRGFGVIEYSHPVEAVQAVSLFDRKLLYDRQMIVRIDRMAGHDDAEFKLPEGLTNIGLGLGPNGQPFPQVAKTLRKSYNNNFNNGPPANNNNNNNFNYNQNQNNNNNFNGMNWNGGNNNFNNSNNSSMMMMNNNNNNNNMMGMNNMIQNIPAPVQPPQSLSIDTTNQMMPSINNSNNNNLGIMNNMAGPIGGSNDGGGGGGVGYNSSMGIIGNYDTISQNNTIRGYTTTAAPGVASVTGGGGVGGGGGGVGGVGSSTSTSNYQSMNVDNQNIIGSVSVSDTIVIKNLPPSCDWQMLRDKFNDIGEVKFAEIRGNDCGIVRFVKARDAELAIKLMDGARFDGHNIHVLLY